MDSLNLIFNKDLIEKKIFPYNSSLRIVIKDNFFTKSAIIFAIIPYKNKPYELILIHRTNKGKKHRGEMSFPGGKVDPIDKSLKDTALRECEEEIGVPRKNIEIIGCLHDFPTLTQYIITPFLGIINKNQKLIKDDREVQAIVKVPIDFFINKKNFKEKAFNIEGNKFSVFYFNYKNREDGKIYTIWGATAYIIVSFIEIVYKISLSKFGLKRFNLEKIKALKDYIKYKHEITHELK
ncbi:MAG: NUDIX hydrolase [Promethearchaeota archaeon]